MLTITKLRNEFAKNSFSDVTIKPSDSPEITFIITAPFFVDNDITNITIDDSNNITIRREEYANFITLDSKTLHLVTILEHAMNRKDN